MSLSWKKYGQIFDFTSLPFKERFVSHAQSPQALVFRDFVRVYFTSRYKDSDTSCVSVPQYIDFSKDFTCVLDYSKNDIIALGKLGCFDEHGIFPFSPLRVQDTIFAYISGWQRRVSVDVETGIGLAMSKDNGKTFSRLAAGPVLTSSLHEPFLVVDGFVKIFEDTFYMFYIFGKKWCDDTPNQTPERVYKIGYATSTDGIHWKKAHKQIISDVIDENECQALPTVIKIDDTYHMYFCYRSMIGFRTGKDEGYRLGYAYSKDLHTWIRDDDKAGIERSQQGFDSDMMCYPNLFEMDDKIFLLYNGNNFGKCGFGIAELIR